MCTLDEKEKEIHEIIIEIRNTSISNGPISKGVRSKYDKIENGKGEYVEVTPTRPRADNS